MVIMRHTTLVPKLLWTESLADNVEESLPPLPQFLNDVRQLDEKSNGSKGADKAIDVLKRDVSFMELVKTCYRVSKLLVHNPRIYYVSVPATELKNHNHTEKLKRVLKP